MAPKVDPNEIKIIYLRATGGEVGSTDTAPTMSSTPSSPAYLAATACGLVSITMGLSALVAPSIFVAFQGYRFLPLQQTSNLSSSS
ncbi:uncharacterized protein JCM10292_002856 [Rhodotorula paludigena]|uniref:uncharacterized protein n=1 Tax=Rhodotorula paludigena TaxID=86838 RepID=UPI00316CA4CC